MVLEVTVNRPGLLTNILEVPFATYKQLTPWWWAVDAWIMYRYLIKFNKLRINSASSWLLHTFFYHIWSNAVNFQAQIITAYIQCPTVTLHFHQQMKTSVLETFANISSLSCLGILKLFKYLFQLCLRHMTLPQLSWLLAHSWEADYIWATLCYVLWWWDTNTHTHTQFSQYLFVEQSP
jgi:hypothetical protein